MIILAIAAMSIRGQAVRTGPRLEMGGGFSIAGVDKVVEGGIEAILALYTFRGLFVAPEIAFHFRSRDPKYQLLGGGLELGYAFLSDKRQIWPFISAGYACWGDPGRKGLWSSVPFTAGVKVSVARNLLLRLAMQYRSMYRPPHARYQAGYGTSLGILAVIPRRAQ